MTMEISQFGFVLLAVYSFCFGGMLGVLYDVLRITRVVLGAQRKNIGKLDLRRIDLPLIKRNACPENNSRIGNAFLNIYIAVGDILFALVCGTLSAMIAYAYNDGKIRIIIFVGAVFGFLAYYNTIGRIVMKLSELVAWVVRCMVIYCIEGMRFLIIKIKRKGAKNDKRQERKTKKSVIC